MDHVHRATPPNKFLNLAFLIQFRVHFLLVFMQGRILVELFLNLIFFAKLSLTDSLALFGLCGPGGMHIIEVQERARFV